MKIICYLPFGYPSIDESLKIAEQYIEAGCDMIEMCIPTDDPYLEPELLAEKMHISLSKCSDYDIYFDKLSKFIKNYPNISIIFVIYEDLIIKIGVDKLIDYMKANGIKDLIYAGDVHHPEVRSHLIESGIQLSSPVSHLMTEAELDGAVNSNGFVYMEGKSARGNKPGYESLEACISELRRLGIDRPIYCGVGIHTTDDVRNAKESGADGVFIGSTLIKLYGEKEKMQETIRLFKQVALE